MTISYTVYRPRGWNDFDSLEDCREYIASMMSPGELKKDLHIWLTTFPPNSVTDKGDGYEMRKRKYQSLTVCRYEYKEDDE